MLLFSLDASSRPTALLLLAWLQPSDECDTCTILTLLLLSHLNLPPFSNHFGIFLHPQVPAALQLHPPFMHGTRIC